MRSLVTKVVIQADAQGNAPTTIELLHTGTWKAPWHGEWETTPADLHEYVRNFEAGVGLVQGDKRAPINYGHLAGDKAAGWITRVYLSDDGNRLLGDVQWTPAAAQAIKDGEWKYISPEFNPRSLPWEDPEEEYHFVANVITGAAVTNIPLFSKLAPITASVVRGSGDKNNQEGDDMNLQELLAKKKEELSEEQLQFVTEHKDELTDEQRKAFGLEETDEEREAREKAEAEEADRKKKEEEEEQKRVDASKKQISISADRLNALEADAKAGREAAQKLAQKEAEEIVDRHIMAGRVKSGERDNTVKMLLASSGDSRKSMEAFLSALPENKLLASEQGSGSQSEEAPTVSDEEAALAASFGNTPEEIAEFKKAKN